MPPETTPVTPETPVTPPAIPVNTPEARTATGELKEGLSNPPPAPTETPKEQPKAGETKSTDPSKTLLNGKENAPKEGAKAPEGTPEKYEFTGLPEGLTVPEDVTSMFKEKGFSQDQAQSAIDFYVKKSREAAEAPAKFWQKQNDDWRAEIEKDPEYKGDIQGMTTSVSRLLDGLGDQKLVSDFRQAMDFTGAGNNPAFVKVMYRLAQQLNEGTYVRPGGPSPHGQRQPGTNERPSVAKALFPGLS